MLKAALGLVRSCLPALPLSALAVQALAVMACGSSSGSPAAPAEAGAVFPPLKFSAIGKPVKVSDRFYFTEGPVWDPSRGVLYFSDTNGDPAGTADGGPGSDAGSGASPPMGGVVYRLTPPSTIDVLFQPSGNADGLGLDPHGNLIGAGYRARDAWRRGADGMLQVLSPCSKGDGTCYMGTEINTPDDVTARSDGTLYFTDPTFANGGNGFPSVTLPLAGMQSVYRLTTDGVLHREDSSTSGPNGINLSPDEKTLYVAYSTSGTVSKFDVAADGSLSNKRTFATGALAADSMCVDAGGNVYVGTFSGLAVYDPTGRSLGTISVDGTIVTNCAFGGADQRTLYVTSRTVATLTGAPPLGGGLLYRIDAMPVPGIPGQN
jgi:gluconolactonase